METFNFRQAAYKKKTAQSIVIFRASPTIAKGLQPVKNYDVSPGDSFPEMIANRVADANDSVCVMIRDQPRIIAV